MHIRRTALCLWSGSSGMGCGEVVGAVFETIFNFVLGPPPPGGPGGGSGLPFSWGNRRLWAGSDPDPGDTIF